MVQQFLAALRIKKNQAGRMFGPAGLILMSIVQARFGIDD
jgi:hypothetical protein